MSATMFYYLLNILYLNTLLWTILVIPITEVKADDSDLGCYLKQSGETYQNDLVTNLKNHDFYGKKFSCHSENYTYDFSVCGDSFSTVPNASIVRRNHAKGTPESIGSRYNVTLSGKNDGWTYMELGPGDAISDKDKNSTLSLSSSVMFICDMEHDTPKFNLLNGEHNNCHYVFEFRTASFCEKKGMGGWSIFFLILFIGFLVYFAGGVAYLRFMTGAKGVAQIPHQYFWVLLGNKFADGCNILCRCKPCCGDGFDEAIQSPYSSGYSPIGETSPTLGSNSNPRDVPILSP